MTDEEINKLIAETCGWTDFIIHPEFELMGVPPDSHGLRTAVNWYTVDLNAMHDAQAKLNEHEFVDYIWNIMRVCHEPMQSTARQRAEAFLRTIGKWEDGK